MTLDSGPSLLTCRAVTRPFAFSPDAYGAHAGGELHVAMHPRAVLERIRKETDELHAWEGGGVVFGRKPFLGEIRRNTFRVRALSFRRDGAVGFLIGEVEPEEGGSVIHYRIESPLGFVRSLPFVSVAPAALFGIGGYLAAPVLFLMLSASRSPSLQHVRLADLPSLPS